MTREWREVEARNAERLAARPWVLAVAVHGIPVGTVGRVNAIGPGAGDVAHVEFVYCVFPGVPGSGEKAVVREALEFLPGEPGRLFAP